VELVACAREAFGWGGDVVVAEGPRGALGRIWRVDTGGKRFALKEIFAEPPSDAGLAVERSLTGRAAAAGVRIPASHPDRTGRLLVTTPDGTWLRLYDWVDLAPADRTAPATARDLGTLLARLHRCAPAARTESDGGVPNRWYDTVPAAWPSIPDIPWAPRLAEKVAALPGLCAAVTPADPAGMVVCHRDLHPDNVLVGPAGVLVVVDWDNLGPAVPGRELAQVLFDWFCEGPAVDLAAVRETYAAYVRAGGPGRITAPADFTMMLATQLNYLLTQLRVMLDPHAAPRDKTWAEREIDEGLRLMPGEEQLDAVLTATG
jgi:Ser/Thr protein kinase RdoA (MazF antagonist)